MVNVTDGTLSHALFTPRFNFCNTCFNYIFQQYILTFMMLKQTFNLHSYGKSESNMDSDDLNKPMLLHTQYSHET